MNKKKGTGRGVGLYIIAFVVLLVTLSLLLGPGETAAPVSYTEIRGDIKSGNVTALVIGATVGFVNVVESKELLRSMPGEHIIAMGRKGGSNVAAAICNAMLYMASGNQRE